jgi:hypothetical protein
VLAASAGSLDTNESTAASAAKTEPVLFQNKATDIWIFFKAKCLRKNMYDIAAAERWPEIRRVSGPGLSK